MDWNVIRTEYIAGGISYRKLAEKYGLSRRTIEERAKSEGWYKQKQAVSGKTVAKTVEIISDVEANKAVKIVAVADEMLEHLYALASASKDLTPKDLRDMSATLKNLKEIKGVKTELEIREQEAHIANLEKQAQKDNTDDEIEVVMDAFEEYSI